MIEKIVVYEDFYKSGSTALLKNVFESPLSYEVDTVFLSVDDKEISDFEFILNNADVKKHKQMKINVDLALLVTIQSQEHHFVISESSNVIIDLTDNLNYRLNTDELQNKAKEFVEKYN
ncbi:MAG: hypothetical protein PHN55_14240 [Dysgonamonadaceae bacterium]|nr:hypothetical protein [Dysgonamonadaceae bacterium]